MRCTLPTPRLLLALVALGSLAAVGVVYVAQHQFGVKPCAWCVLQRALFLLLAVVCGLASLAGGVRPLRLTLSGLGLAITLAGLASAYYQHEVAAQQASCAMGLADRIVTALDLEMTWPEMFMITANCADAATYRLLSLPYEVWSALGFAAALGVLLLSLRRR
ncbi:disulfide bond formation protein B [Roseateles sp. BYS180W]|uniref:Disulfide bond formation protein B n=1 Tax=Roseateles rivi TaxID=3299028 RepID=A0ABW7FYE4_9BURK